MSRRAKYLGAAVMLTIAVRYSWLAWRAALDGFSDDAWEALAHVTLDLLVAALLLGSAASKGWRRTAEYLARAVSTIAIALFAYRLISLVATMSTAFDLFVATVIVVVHAGALVRSTVFVRRKSELG